MQLGDVVAGSIVTNLAFACFDFDVNLIGIFRSVIDNISDTIANDIDKDSLLRSWGTWSLAASSPICRLRALTRRGNRRRKGSQARCSQGGCAGCARSPRLSQVPLSCCPSFRSLSRYAVSRVPPVFLRGSVGSSCFLSRVESSCWGIRPYVAQCFWY